VDRVERALGVVLVLTGLAVLLGAQGARIGSYWIPAISWWWVIAIAGALLLLAPSEAGVKLGRKALLSLAVVLVSFLLLAFWRSRALEPSTSLLVRVDSERDVRARSLQLERRNELRRLTGKRRNVTLETEGVLEVPESGSYRFELSCDDSCELTVGGRTLRAEGDSSETLDLDQGELPFSLRYRQGTGPARLSVAWNRPAALELLPIDYYLRSTDAPARSRVSAHLALFFFGVFWLGLASYLSKLGHGRAVWIASPWVPRAFVALLILYGGLLRFEALLAHSGLTERSELAAEVHESLLPVLPRYGIFNPDLAPDDPYRADVRSYLDRAAAMTVGGFYAPSFREPFYVLLVKLFVALFGGGEIGILVESFLFSVATLPLFAWLARKLYGLWWAVALLLPVSLHEWLVLEAPTGYRMSAYGFFLLAFAAAALLGARATRRFSFVVEGAFAGLLTLIRLSALSVVAPVLFLRASSLPSPRRRSFVLGFLAVLAALVVPFLFSNYRAHGDPFYSVSFHTQFWLRAEGLDEGQGSVSVLRYFTDFGRATAVLKGTFLGMTALPLRTFWNGLQGFPVLGLAALLLGVPGLLMLHRRENRILAAIYFGHLLPFAYIQNFPSGEMPRFVMPAFFLLVLAIPSVVRVSTRREGRGLRG
jgi:PA14 domain